MNRTRKAVSEQISANSKKETKTLSRLRAIRYVSIIVVVMGICFLFLFRPANVNGNSMYPTLKNGDIGINNVLYAKLNKIERFDIVEFYDSKQQLSYFKRVIGLPGEMVQYRDDKLYINGEVKDEYFLDNEYIKKIIGDSGELFTQDFGPIKLKENEYFICGDNRINSADSRSFGAINESAIKSVGFLRIID